MKSAILIVDDGPINRDIMADLLQDEFGDEFDILLAGEGDEAMQIIDANSDRIAVIVLDLEMPKKDGFAVLDFMRFNMYSRDIPVIVVTADENIKKESKALNMGADDFITKSSNPDIVRRRVSNLIELYQYKRDLERMIREQTEKFMQISDFVIDVLMTVMQAKNKNSRASILRIRSYTREILEFLSGYWDDFYALSPVEIDLVVAASVLHDIGEVAVPESIFAKQPLLTPEEQEILESHTEHGCEIVKSLDSIENGEYVKTALEICRWHHERWDGSGYPDHLAGNQIPVSAQVVGLADTYEGLRTGVIAGRNYTHEEALYSIEHGEFGAFSPVLTEAIKVIGGNLEKIHDEMEAKSTKEKPWPTPAKSAATSG